MAEQSDVTVDISGAVEKFKKAGVRMDVAVPKLISKLAGEGERYMKRAVPVDTGNLRNSITSNVSGYHGQVGASADYAVCVNNGTRPHTIVPRFSNVLAFTVAGQMVFTRRVFHPGTKGIRFVEATAEKLNSIAGSTATTIIRKEMAGLS